MHFRTDQLVRIQVPEARRLHRLYVLWRDSLHLHPHQLVGIGFKPRGSHLLYITRRHTLDLQPHEVIGARLQSQVVEFTDIFRRNSLHFHPDQFIDVEVGIEGPHLANVFRGDALHTHAHEFVRSRLQPQLMNFSHVLRSDTLNLHGHQFIHGQVLEARRLHRVQIGLLLIEVVAGRLLILVFVGLRLRRGRSRRFWRLCGALLGRSRFRPDNYHAAASLLLSLRCVGSQRGMRDSQKCVARQQCSHETDETGRQSPYASSAPSSIPCEHSQDALRKRAAIGGHHQSRSRPPFFHQRECPRVIHGVAAKGDGLVVAAVLALGANSLAHPPDRRVVEQQRFCGHLEKIHETIEAANVRQLMRDDRFDLLFGQAGQRPHRQQHDGTEPSEYRWSVQPMALAILDDTVEAHSSLQRQTSFVQLSTDRLDLFAPHPLDQKQSPRGSQAQQKDAQEPRFHQPQHGARLYGARFGNRGEGA